MSKTAYRIITYFGAFIGFTFIIVFFYGCSVLAKYILPIPLTNEELTFIMFFLFMVWNMSELAIHINEHKGR